MNQLNEKEKVFSEQVTVMFEIMEDNKHPIRDFIAAMDTLIEVKRNNLFDLESKFALQEEYSKLYEEIGAKISLEYEVLDSYESIREFFVSILTSTVQPLSKCKIISSTYALLLDINNIHTIRFKFEIGNPIEDLENYLDFFEQLECIREFLVSL